MATKISIDKSGRVILPKRIRDRMALSAGDELLVGQQGEQITLRPVRSVATLKKEHGVWVYQDERSEESISELVEKHREDRLRDQGLKAITSGRTR